MDHLTEIVRRLVANLLGDKDRRSEMLPNAITPADIVDMPFEYEVLYYIGICCDANHAPTAARVGELLVAAGKSEYALSIPELLTYSTDDREIAFLAFELKQMYLAKRENVKILADMAAMLESPEGLPYQNRRDAFQHLSARMPVSLNARHYSLAESSKSWIDSTLDYHHRVEQGYQLGPNWPFKGLNDLIPVLKPGDLTTIMMKTKYGKTSLAGILAEHWAFRQRYNVLFLLFETDANSWFDRMIARQCLVPSRARRLGLLDLHDPFNPTTKKIARFLRRIGFSPPIEGEPVLPTGRLDVIECAGWGLTDTRAAVDLKRHQAAMDGTEVIVIVDYGNEVNKQGLFTMGPNAHNIVVDGLKNMTQQLGVYMVNFWQEKDEHVTPKDGTSVITRSQNFLRMDRKIAVDRLVAEENGGTPALNALGEQRVFHDVGQLHSDAFLQVLRSNDDATGAIKLRTEMSLYRMNQGADQVLPNDLPLLNA